MEPLFSFGTKSYLALIVLGVMVTLNQYSGLGLIRVCIVDLGCLELLWTCGINSHFNNNKSDIPGSLFNLALRIIESLYANLEVY